jgi:hypothetical protein
MLRETETKLSVVTPDAAIRTYEENVMEGGLDEAFSFAPIDHAATASADCGVILS